MPLIRNPRFNPLRRAGLTDEQVQALLDGLETFFTNNRHRELIPDSELLTALRGAGIPDGIAFRVVRALAEGLTLG